MKTFRITISIDEETTTEKKIKAEGLGDLFSRGLDMLREKEDGRMIVIPASRIREIFEVLGKNNEQKVY